jgi:hypothetical protein
MADAYNKLDKFSVAFLKSNGDIKDRSIQRWHLAFDAAASGGLTHISPVTEDIYPDASGHWAVGTQQYAFYEMNAHIMRADYGYFSNLFVNGYNLSGLHEIHDADKDTRIDVEKYYDEDKIRMDTAGVERVVIDENGFEQKIGDIAVQENEKVMFNGIGGDTYWVHNPVTDYFEAWVNGSKRMEM